jgi:hypothetical protein
MPRVFILGCQKCGTTTLHALLKQHPSIISAKQLENEPRHYGKELHFFDAPYRFDLGLPFYLSHFSSDDNKSISTSTHGVSHTLRTATSLRIDATPKYVLHHPYVFFFFI